MESPERFLALLDKYTDNNITVTEQEELFLMIASGEYDHLFEEQFYTRYHSEPIPGNDMSMQRAQEIIHNIRSAEKQTSRLLPGIFRKKKIIRWSLAASIIGVLAFVTWLFLIINNQRPATVTAGLSGKKLVEKANNMKAAVLLKMEDGSVITLQPGAVLHFPDHFSAGRREVYLDGEAFFEVTKNADRPFFVYHNNLVTHVLGTSFNVKADKRQKVVEVSVITGKVRVYENKNLLPANSAKNNGVILTPNQKVIYKEDDRQFTATLINDPLPLVHDTLSVASASASAPAPFAFDETPVSQVIQTIEKIYGIEIVVENDKLYNCLFTGNITKHPLYTKLDIICASVKASYQVVGTKILLKGKGCD